MAIFARKRGKRLRIRALSYNRLKSRIFAFLSARKISTTNSRGLEGIVVKIFDSDK